MKKEILQIFVAGALFGAEAVQLSWDSALEAYRLALLGSPVEAFTEEIPQRDIASAIDRGFLKLSKLDVDACELMEFAFDQAKIERLHWSECLFVLTLTEKGLVHAKEENLRLQQRLAWKAVS